ncbi:MAG: ubiquinol-cytochrome C chaperone family protein [Micropepsaceae bacterium]
MFQLFGRIEHQREVGRALYRAISAQARSPEFYTRFAVPDTIDGRFDLLALHGFLAMKVLKGCGKTGERIGTHLATSIFESLEEALRELGVGDIGISRRIKAMADAFYGRLAVYSAAEGESEMRDALIRNLYRGDNNRDFEALLLARYMLQSLESLTRPGSESALLQGEVEFALPPEK